MLKLWKAQGCCKGAHNGTTLNEVVPLCASSTCSNRIFFVTSSSMRSSSCKSPTHALVPLPRDFAKRSSSKVKRARAKQWQLFGLVSEAEQTTATDVTSRHIATWRRHSQQERMYRMCVRESKRGHRRSGGGRVEQRRVSKCSVCGACVT